MGTCKLTNTVVCVGMLVHWFLTVQLCGCTWDPRARGDRAGTSDAYPTSSALLRLTVMCFFLVVYDCLPPAVCAVLVLSNIGVQSAGVAAYLAGHDHDLQHVVKLSNPDDDTSDPVWPHHVISGAGSETRSGEKQFYKGKVRVQE